MSSYMDTIAGEDLARAEVELARAQIRFAALDRQEGASATLRCEIQSAGDDVRHARHLVWEEHDDADAAVGAALSALWIVGRMLDDAEDALI